MWRRLVAYSLGSVVAASCGEGAFVLVYGWLGAGTWAASAAGFVGGAIPNFVVNRRWVWGDRRGRRRGAELGLYWGIATTSYLASVAATAATGSWARGLTDDRTWRVVAVAAAYLGVSGVFFLAKFVVFHLVVFTPPAAEVPAAPAGPATARRAPARPS